MKKKMMKTAAAVMMVLVLFTAIPFAALAADEQTQITQEAAQETDAAVSDAQTVFAQGAPTGYDTEEPPTIGDGAVVDYLVKVAGDAMGRMIETIVLFPFILFFGMFGIHVD